jgi:hypothetical protein
MKPAKDGLAIILASKAKKKPDADLGAAPEGEDGGDMEEGKMAAAEDVMAAMKSGDAQAFKDALQDFVDLCY